MARQIVLQPGERVALRQLHYRGELLRSVLITYRDRERGIAVDPWHQDEPPHTRYYSGAWRLIEEDSDNPRYLLTPVE